MALVSEHTLPFLAREAPPTPIVAVRPHDRLLVAGWLFAVCFMVLVMVALGGATRLTGSGLSIMEWAPLTGALPPWSAAEWQRLYNLYRHIPQAELVNSGIGLDGFKHIFWLEWVHRLWGRLIGVVFLVPLLVLAWRGAISRTLLPRLALLFALGGLQGAVGWFMVASGFFPDSTAVSPYRLVIHLALALTLYAALLWTGLSVLNPLPTPAAREHRGNHHDTAPKRNFARKLAALTVAFVALTIVAGGFVAGLHAGLIYNTFPLMDGHVVPETYAQLSPGWRNLTENVAAVQFDHRLMATLTALVAAFTAWAGYRQATTQGGRRAFAALGLAVGAQYALGVATLLWVVPVSLATAHQSMAVLLLTAGIVALHTSRRAAW